jgi:hypothetical protein
VPIFYIDNNKTNSMIQKDIQKLLFLKLVQVAVDKDDNLIVRLTCAKNAEDTSGFVLNITSTVSKAKNNNLANQEQLPQDNNKGVCEHAKNSTDRGNESNGQEEENNIQTQDCEDVQNGEELFVENEVGTSKGDGIERDYAHDTTNESSEFDDRQITDNVDQNKEHDQIGEYNRDERINGETHQSEMEANNFNTVGR